MVRRVGVVAGILASAVCASALADPQDLAGDKGLGVLGKKTPDALREAASDPYAMPPPPVCQNADQELAALTQILGPDVDAPAAKTNRVGEWAGGAVRHLVPYRGWVRFVTGADRRDKAYAKAAQAGWERRGFLKGLERQYDCLHQGDALIAQAADDAATDVADNSHPAADPAQTPPDQVIPASAPPLPAAPPAPSEPAPN